MPVAGRPARSGRPSRPRSSPCRRRRRRPWGSRARSASPGSPGRPRHGRPRSAWDSGRSARRRWAPPRPGPGRRAGTARGVACGDASGTGYPGSPDRHQSTDGPAELGTCGRVGPRTLTGEAGDIDRPGRGLTDRGRIVEAGAPESAIHHHARKPPPNASPLPTVSTTAMRGTGSSRRMRAQDPHRSRPVGRRTTRGPWRAGFEPPRWRVGPARCTRGRRRSPSRCPRGPGRREAPKVASRSAMTHGRQFGSTIRSVSSASRPMPATGRTPWARGRDPGSRRARPRGRPHGREDIGEVQAGREVSAWKR